MTVEEGKEVVDIAAASTGVMALAAWLPPIASVFTIVWLGIRIFESIIDHCLVLLWLI